MVDTVNVILFVVTIFVTAKLIGKILALEEIVMEKEDEIRILKRSVACQESTIARMRAGHDQATVEAVDPVEELEEGEIRPTNGGAYHGSRTYHLTPTADIHEPVRDRRR